MPWARPMRCLVHHGGTSFLALPVAAYREGNGRNAVPHGCSLQGTAIEEIILLPATAEGLDFSLLSDLGRSLPGAFRRQETGVVTGRRLPWVVVPCKEQLLGRAFFPWELNKSFPTFSHRKKWQEPLKFPPLISLPSRNPIAAVGELQDGRGMGGTLKDNPTFFGWQKVAELCYPPPHFFAVLEPTCKDKLLEGRGIMEGGALVIDLSAAQKCLAPALKSTHLASN